MKAGSWPLRIACWSASDSTGVSARVVGEQLAVPAVEQVLDHEAAHLVGRVPARPHRDVGHARVQDRVRVLPAHRAGHLHGGAGAVGLVAGGVGAVVQHAVLHVDEAREDELGEQRGALRLVVHRLLPQAEEDAIGVDDLAALHERQPRVEPLRPRALDGQRLLVRPVHLGQRRLALELDLVEPHVVPGHLAEELVPRIEARRHVPDGLGVGQVGQLGRHQRHQVEARARAQQAVVVVDEPRHAVVEALVVRHVRVGRVDAHDLAGQLGERDLRPHQVVEDVAGRLLVPLEDLVLEPRIGSADLGTHGPVDGGGHGDAPLRVAENVSRPGGACQMARAGLGDGPAVC